MIQLASLLYFPRSSASWSSSCGRSELTDSACFFPFIIYFIIVTMLNLAHHTPRPLFSPLLFNFSIKNRKKYFFNIRDEPEVTIPAVYPNQYPSNLVDASPMIHRGRPVRFETPRDQIPETKMMSNDDAVISQIYKGEWRSPENSYKLNVGLIGPVNSGKSQLLSKLSHKVSAVSPKKNTTDEVIHAYKSFEIQNEEGLRNIQLKYYDTPGLSQHKTGYLSRGWKVLKQLDFTLLVIDSAKKFDDLVQQSINRLEKHRQYEHFMKALVLNKIDLVDNKRKFHGLIAQIEKHGKFDKIFYTSALTGYGVPQIQSYLCSLAKKGDWDCPNEVKTDSSEVQIVEEMLKEALYHRTYNAVPYNLVIECQSLSKKTNGVHFIQFRVMVQSEIVQRIVIGKKGQNINWVRDHFKSNYAKFYGAEVEVHVRVVIRKKVLTRGSEEIEDSFYQQEKKQTMNMLKKELTYSGKMLK